jgi:hypothetical protein
MAALVSNETRIVSEVDGPLWVENGPRLDQADESFRVAGAFRQAAGGLANDPNPPPNNLTSPHP